MDTYSSSRVLVIRPDGTYDEPPFYEGINGRGSKYLVNNTIEKIIFSEGIESVNQYSYYFDRFISLKEVLLPSSLKKIGEFVFYGCKALESIHFQEGLLEIGSSAFWQCLSLREVYLPDSVKVLGTCAFWECKSIESFSFPSDVTEVPVTLLMNCSSLKQIVIPDSVTAIGEDAFNGCISLSSVQMPENLQKIDNSGFYKCEALKHVALPERLTYIGESAFAFSGLAEIAIPASVDTVEDMAFMGCHSLGSVIIGSTSTHFPNAHMTFPEDTEVRGNGFSIPGKTRWGRLSMFLTALAVVSASSLLIIPAVIAIILYYKKKMSVFSLFDSEGWKCLYVEIFNRGWKDRLPK